jgi:hypothetical protein
MLLERLAAECSRLAVEVREASADQKAARDAWSADLLAVLTDLGLTGDIAAPGPAGEGCMAGGAEEGS